MAGVALLDGRLCLVSEALEVRLPVLSSLIIPVVRIPVLPFVD